ncbi:MULTISPECIES: hypothetical protein [Nostocales]|uniref:Uncharacterized protein n=3 Tax=Nostocales TaxID=1161 RepID=A0A0C1QMB9_9CYAN|nr:hypothetical protein [Tolypothrix bouteillei]KAF3889983.1 hypothetical protein DA73_0400034370 [Tolypothrix bouteillei VB521301]
MNILDACKLSREISQDVEKLFNNSRHQIKQYLGEVIIYDLNYVTWRVKICSPETRGYYLKTSRLHIQDIKVSIPGNKTYLKVTPDEWEVFYQLAHGVENVRDRAQDILNKLVG